MIPTDAAKNRFADAIPPTMPTSGPMAWTPWSVEEFSAKLRASHPHYRILSLIGHGGMGAVYQATDTQKGHAVAIKVMRPDLLAEGDFVERFHREIQILRELKHPHIISLVDRGLTADGVPFLVMPYLEGRSLAEVIQDKERLTLPRILALMQQLCSGTAALHDKGIIHRDLKPANIFLRAPDDHAIILDLGIARPQMPLDGLHTQTGLTLGTESYMAPEVKAGKKAEKTADIYALGVILYQLLTQRFPEGNCPPPSAFGHDPRFDAILAQARHQDPRERYQSVTEFAEALKVIHTPATSSAPISDDTSRQVVIEIEDYRITINGFDFTFFATLDQVVEALGPYSRTSNLYISEYRNAPYGAIYYWDTIGISVFVRMFSDEIPHVISFNVWFSSSLCVGGQTSDHLLQLLEGVPFVKDTPRSSFTGRMRFYGDNLDSDSSEILIQKHRLNNFFNQAAAGYSPDMDVIYSPDNSPGVNPAEKLSRQLLHDPMKGIVVKVCSLVHRASRKCAAVTFWPMTSEKRNGAIGAYDLERIDIGHELGRFVRSRVLDEFTKLPVKTVNKAKSQNWFDSLQVDENLLLAGPGPAYHFDCERRVPHPKWESWESTRPIYGGWFLLTNKRVLAKSSEGEWTAFSLSDFPRIMNLIRESGREATVNSIVSLGQSEKSVGKLALLALSKWFVELFPINDNIEESRQKWRVRVSVSSQSGYLDFATPFVPPSLPPENFELLKQELSFLFHCVGILAFDKHRKFPKSWVAAQHGSSGIITDEKSNLRLCPTCGKEIAKSARTCPHCGENLRSRQKPSGWRQKACSNCGEVMSRFAQKCQQPDCGHPNTWLKVQSTLATLAVLGGGFWCWQHYTQHQTQGLLLPIAATVLALGWRGSLSLLKSFYSH